MELKALQIISSVAISVFLTFLCFVCYFLARFLASKSRKVHSGRNNPARLTAVSIFYCFACGVFLGTTFLRDIPHLNKDAELLDNLTNQSSPNSKQPLFKGLPKSGTLIIGGFLLCLLLRHIVGLCGVPNSNQESDSEFWLGKQDEDPWETAVEASEPDKGQKGKRRKIKSTSKQEKVELEYRRLPTSGNKDDVMLMPRDASSQHRIFPSIALLLPIGVQMFADGMVLGTAPRPDFWQLPIHALAHHTLSSIAYSLCLAKHAIPLKLSIVLIPSLAGNLIGGLIFGLLVPDHKLLSIVLPRFLGEGLAAGVMLCTVCLEMIGVELGRESVGCPALVRSVGVAIGILVVFALEVCLLM